MNKVTLYIGVGLKNEAKQEEIKFVVEASEDVGVDVLRDAPDSWTNFYIDAENTFILSRKKEDVNIKESDHPIILEMEIAIKDDVDPKDIRFTVNDHFSEDGFTLSVTENNKGEITDDLVIAVDSFVTGRIKG